MRPYTIRVTREAAGDVRKLPPRLKKKLKEILSADIALDHLSGLRPICGQCKTPLDASPALLKGARERKWVIPGIVIAGGCFIVVAALMLNIRRSMASPIGQGGAPPTWLSISYADLLDTHAIIRTGQNLGSALRDARLRNAVQPFVDGYSQLLPASIEIAQGPDQTPCHSVLDFFTPGERQPAWVAILRGGRIHIVTDDKNHAKVFLLGDDPKQAYSRNYSVVRHCLSMLSRLANGDLNVDVFAYHNDYARSELRLNTRPYSFRANAFEPRKPVVDLDALVAFFAEGPEIQGAALKKDEGLILYGSEGPKPTLAGKPVELSDLAVAYRAVFHAGDNEAFISLDPNNDPTKVTVNFGGFLENTRLGSVVLEADKRFKTITSGLDPNSFRDVRNYTRNHVSSFLSGAERTLLRDAQRADVEWIGTRFWYYPDAIGVDSDLNWEYAVITNPRFTADAERSREDFASPEEFERKKRDTLSPIIRENIDDLNRNYVRYAQAFPEISELTTVARLMGLCSWLFKAHPAWLDCDELLSVELPPCITEVERTQLIAATFFSHPKEELTEPQRIIEDSKVVFLSPILDKTVDEFFQSGTNVVKYLSGESEPTAAEHVAFDSEAARLFGQYRYRKVRDMLHAKRDVELFATYAASTVDVPPPTAAHNLEDRITADKTTLTNLESAVTQIKRRMSLETTPETYNASVHRHNQLVDEYQRVRTRLTLAIDHYNALNIQVPHIVEIGGGISLEPSKFAVRRNASSPKLIEFKSRISNVGPRWTDLRTSRKWMRSDSTTRGTSPGRPRTKLDERMAVGYQIKHWTRTDARDGSWKAVVRLDATRAQEKSYNAPQQQLQVAEFTSGQLHALVIAQRDAKGRIVFRRADRRDVPPPQDPPVWQSPN
ncbi:MAG: hypothetical protein WCP22_01970 [Chlamydiota bacterium]